jgi:hypothetical protein
MARFASAVDPRINEWGVANQGQYSLAAANISVCAATTSSDGEEWVGK